MTLLPCAGCGHKLAAGVRTCPVCGRSRNGTPAGGGLSPELLAWAREQFNEEEFLAGLREVRETGGLELRDFLPQLEQEAGLRD